MAKLKNVNPCTVTVGSSMLMKIAISSLAIPIVLPFHLSKSKKIWIAIFLKIMMIMRMIQILPWCYDCFLLEQYYTFLPVCWNITLFHSYCRKIFKKLEKFILCLYDVTSQGLPSKMKGSSPGHMAKIQFPHVWISNFQSTWWKSMLHAEFLQSIFAFSSRLC